MLRGLIPPIPTPFDADGDLDPAALESLVGTLEAQVDGLLVLGSNGEAVYLSEEERRLAVKTARAAAPRQPLLVGTGAETTRLVIERNRQAAELGADYVLVLPPHYYKGMMTGEVLERHYRELADASPLPVLLYNMPAATGLSLSPGLVAELATHPNIVGLKDSSGHVGNLTEIMRRVPADFTVLTGNAPTLLAALSLGVEGGILAVANVAAGPYKTIIDLVGAGRWSEARDLQLRYNPLALAVTSGHGVPGLKAVMRLQGVSAGYPRAPLPDVSEAVKGDLAQLLEALEGQVA